MNNDKPSVGCKNAFPNPIQPKDHKPECRVIRSIPWTLDSKLPVVVVFCFVSVKSNGQRTLNTKPVSVGFGGAMVLVVLLLVAIDSVGFVVTISSLATVVEEENENSIGICNLGNA